MCLFLEYAVVVWDGWYKSDSNLIESAMLVTGVTFLKRK